MVDITMNKQTQIIAMYVYDFLCRHIRYITDLIKKMKNLATSLFQTQSNNDMQKQANQKLQYGCFESFPFRQNFVIFVR